jgi:hypothetical protein
MAGQWWAAVPPDGWPDDAEAVALIRAKWDDAVGDARQELVLIGIGMHEAALRRGFDQCLLSDDEMAEGPAAWARHGDPFPGWE